MANNPRGFVPAHGLGTQGRFQMTRRQVSANNPTALFIGDPVELHSDGKVRLIDTSTPSVNVRGVLGIIGGVLDSNERPLTHNLPATGQFIDGSTAGFVDLYEDPDALFVINSDATSQADHIGQYVRVTAGSANSVVGISGFSLRIADTTASSVGHRFQIVDVAPSEQIQGRAGQFSANQDMLVRIADHQWRRAYKRVGAF